MDIIEKIKSLDTVEIVKDDNWSSVNWWSGDRDKFVADILTLVTLIEQQSAVIEEAENALEHYADKANWLTVNDSTDVFDLYDCGMHNGFDCATAALSRIHQMKESK